jgi:opacity protein-like surface antigen
MRVERNVPLAATVALAAALASAAPQRATPKPRAPETGPDLFGGYSYTHAGEASLHGWGLAGTYPFRGAWSAVADLSGHYGSFAGADLGQLAFMAGLRWSARPGSRLRPFAEGLVGPARTSASIDTAGGSVSDADTDWGIALGGGLDYRLNGRWSARGLVHLRLLWGEGATDEDPRFSLGAVYRFGR